MNDTIIKNKMLLIGIGGYTVSRRSFEGILLKG